MPVPNLDALTESDLEMALSALGHSGPIVVVVSSSPHAYLLDNWLRHMDALGIRRIIVIAMDSAIATRLSQSGHSIVRAFFDGSMENFWLQRLRIFSLLARHDIEFIHSDTDAVWLANPIPKYAGNDFDLLFSQGTDMPHEALSAWGFVLCCGFFWARPTPATRKLFDAWINRSEAQFDDQIALNRLLVDKGTKWERGSAASYPRKHRDVEFTCYTELIAGSCPSLGLRLGLFPHHAFPRLDTGGPHGFVRHILTAKEGGTPDERIRLMRADGCWKADEASPALVAQPARPMRLLIYAMQSSGASLFCYFLGQRQNSVAIVDVWSREVTPEIETQYPVVAKATVNMVHTFKEHVERFKPDKTILFVRDPVAVYASLSKYPYANRFGTIEEKMQRMDDQFRNGGYDALIRYEDFVSRDSRFINAINALGWQCELSYFDAPRSFAEIEKFNRAASLWLDKHFNNGWHFGNIHAEFTKELAIRPNGTDPKEKVSKLSPNLCRHYQNFRKKTGGTSI